MSNSTREMLTVLAVDDSVVMQKMVKQALEEEYRVLVASKAIDALALIYHENVALLLLDVSMPGMDGLELCRTVRTLPQFQKLPVVMLTSKDQMFDKVQGRLAGATEYLTKPFDAETLRQVVGKWINVNDSNPSMLNVEC